MPVNKPFDSSPATFARLLGNYELPIIVPPFQRGYSWEKTQVLAFWEDLRAFENDFRQPAARRNKRQTYFLGPIVLMRQDDHIKILDGQQRVATATIMLSVLRDFAQEHDDGKGKKFSDETQRTLIEKDSESGAFSLQLGELDNLYFRSTIQYFPRRIIKPTLRSHKLIYDARAVLEQLLRDDLASAKDVHARLRDLRNVLVSSLVMVSIEVSTEDDAYHIFETLNDRGLRLSVPDLLLNFLMRRCSRQRERSQVREAWSRLLECLGAKDVDRFLRHMWVSNYGDLKSKGLFHEMRTFLGAQDIESLSFADQCLKESEYYMAILTADKDVLGEEAAVMVKAVVQTLQAFALVPALLSGVQCLEKKSFVKLCKRLLTLLTRHQLIRNLNPNQFENISYEVARDIRALSAAAQTDSKILQEITKKLKSIDPSDADVQNDFRRLIVSRPQAQYLLGSLARQIQGGTSELGIVDKTIEHIFPQSPDPCWTKATELKPYLWHIGNLTLLGKRLNKDAASSCISAKSALYKKSDIKMTKALSSLTDWDCTTIEARAANLGSTAVQIWSL